MRILPLLGVCYFFYVSEKTRSKELCIFSPLRCPQYTDKTTLSYAAIFGLQTDLGLVGTQYSWLSS